MSAGLVERMISHDEIGIATARIGGAVVRSAFQPVYEVRGSVLEPVAVEGFARPFRHGAALPPRMFLDRLGAAGRREAEQACLILHARNHQHLASPHLGHVIALDDFVIDGSGRIERNLIEEAGAIAPRDSIGRLRSAAAFGAEGCAALAAILRRNGLLFSLGGFGGGRSVWEEFRAARPDVVHLDGPWFRRVVASGPALKLLAQLVRRLREDGARVLVRGIETRRQLAAAIAIGCDLFQGHVLARPALVGTDADFGARSPDLEDEIERNIVALFE